MKKILETILALICLVAVVLGGAENPDGSCNIIWTLSCLGIAALSGWAWNKLDKSTLK